MTFKSRSAVSVLLLAALLAVPSAAFASKRRAITPRTAGPLVTAAVTGTITDATTGLPVAGVSVSGGRRSSQTDAQGKFEIKAAEGYGDILFEAERSGYLIYRQKLSGAGPFVLNFQLQPTPTVTVKKTDGTTLQMDYENLKFGYAVPFSGYRASETESFCFANGTTAEIHKSQIRKITGPGTNASSACCSARTAMKVTLEQKNGPSGDAFFVDSCETEYPQEVIGTNHTTGVSTYIRFSDIAEIVFP